MYTTSPWTCSILPVTITFIITALTRFSNVHNFTVDLFAITGNYYFHNYSINKVFKCTQLHPGLARYYR